MNPKTDFTGRLVSFAGKSKRLLINHKRFVAGCGNGSGQN